MVWQNKICVINLSLLINLSGCLDEKIQRIEDKNKKINKTIQTVLKKYNGQMDAEQIKEIVIKKIG